MSEIFEHKYQEGKNSEDYYVPLANTKVFINQIADDYDSSFKKVAVYGSNLYPLFILKDVREVLNIPKQTFLDNTNKFIEGFEILKSCKVQITIKRSGIESVQNRDNVNMLTKFGVYRAMFISDSAIAQIFRRFVYIVLHKLETERVARLEDVKKALHKSIEKISDERDSLIVKTHFFREDNTRLRRLEEQVSTKEDYATEGTPEHKLVLLMKKKFFQKTPIYIINPDYVNAKYIAKPKRRKSEKKSKKDDLLDEPIPDAEEKDDQFRETLDEAIYEYDLLNYEIPYDEVFPGDLAMYPDMEFYIHLPAFKSKSEKKQEIYQYVGDIEVLNRDHLTAIKNYYDSQELFTTKMKNVYKISYAGLMSTLNDRISAELFDSAESN